MSYIVLQVGQCGNQLGNDLYNFINSDLHHEDCGAGQLYNSRYVNEGLENWFHGNGANAFTARSIVIDSETKVISQLSFENSKTSPWSYSDTNVLINRNGGSANNWMIGYAETGPKLINLLLDKVQSEIEKCDRVKAFLILSSSGGGTGSGTGSYITEHLKDLFPDNTLINGLVFPFTDGDIATQGFNTVLTISKLYDCSDAIMVFCNDYFYNLNVQHLKNETSSFDVINTLISEQIGCLMQPFDDYISLQDSLMHLTSHPGYKFLTARSSPYIRKCLEEYETPHSWEYLLRGVKRQLNMEQVLTSSSKFNKALCNTVVCRGNKSSSALSSSTNNSELLKMNYPKWISPNDVIQKLTSERKYNGKDKFVTVYSNNAVATMYLDDAVKKAWVAYTHNAFVHHYYKHNLEEEELVRAFMKCESIIKDYGDL